MSPDFLCAVYAYYFQPDNSHIVLASTREHFGNNKSLRIVVGFTLISHGYYIVDLLYHILEYFSSGIITLVNFCLISFFGGQKIQLLPKNLFIMSHQTVQEMFLRFLV